MSANRLVGLVAATLALLALIVVVVLAATAPPSRPCDWVPLGKGGYCANQLHPRRSVRP